MNTNYEYKYKGKNFTIEAAMHIIQSTHRTKRSITKLTDIMQYAIKHHEEKGGYFATMPIKPLVEKALYRLEKNGYAHHISHERWELPKHNQRIYGTGDQFVYLYYFDTYKQSALQNEHLYWRCKIGETTKKPEKYIKVRGTNMPEKPIIALLLRTHDCSNLEKFIHAALKLKGRHIKDTLGNEWFLTNPDEVAQLFVCLNHDLQNFKITRNKTRTSRFVKNFTISV